MAYKTIFEKAEATFVEKRSEFIGYIAPCKTNDEAIEFINNIKARHRKATHNVYAYVLRDNNITRYSDDGEPQGTAGVPVLDVILKEELTDVCVVVTRYFGGILLGGGGLVRAYTHSCKLAIESATIMQMYNCFELSISCDYNMYGKINHLLEEFDVMIVKTEFSEYVSIKLNIKSELCDKLINEIVDLTNAKATIVKSQEFFANFAK